MNTQRVLKCHAKRQQRGTVLIFVVAILSLLLVMGTAFLLMSRQERGGSRAGSDNTNMDLGRDAALNQVRQLLLDFSTLNPGSTNNVLLDQPAAWQANVAYTTAVTPANEVMGTDGRTYYCTSAHTSSTTTAGPPPADNANWSVYNGTIFRSRNFDYPNPGISGTSWSDPSPSNDTSIVAEPFLARGYPSPAAGPTGSASTGDFSVFTQGYRYNASTGTYALALPSSAEVSAMMYPTSAPVNDAIWNMLPYSSADGLRYRYALRVVDTSRFANLNVGNPASTNTDAYGQYLTSTTLGASTIFNALDNASLASLQTNANGRQSGTAFGSSTWQTQILSYEKPTSTTITLFDPSDELELRAYGTVGSSYSCRPTALWPNTLAAGASTNRQYYTTYSFDRNFGPVVNPKFSFSGLNAWPGGSSNRRVNLGATTTTITQLAQNAAYLVNAMSAAGYSDDEAFSFGVNYVAQAYSNYYVDYTAHCTAINIATGLPFGPEYYAPCIDSGGLRIFDGTGVSHVYAITPAPSKTYLAYAAQPYIAAIACFESGNSPTPNGGVQDFAVELYTPPYAIAAVPLSKWQLSVAVNLGTATTWISDLSSPTGGWTTGQYGLSSGIYGGGLVPGSCTIYQTATNSLPVSPITTLQGVQANTSQFSTGSTYGQATNIPATVVLQRPYYSTGGTLSYMVVDRLSAIMPSPSQTAGTTGKKGPQPGTPLAYIFQRNDTNPGVNYSGLTGWGITCAEIQASPTPLQGTNWWLGATAGAPNWTASFPSSLTAGQTVLQQFGSPTLVAGSSSTLVGLHIPDYFADTAAPAGPYSPINSIPTSPARGNIGDLNIFIPRITHMGTPNTTTNQALSDIMADMTGSGTSATTLLELNTTQTGSLFPQEGKLFFDFAADPRAQRFLQLVAPIDRASDGVSQIDGITADADQLDEMRLPGRVNVNTASSQVLQALPGMTSALATNIIAYRDRTGAYSSSTTYPGLGIRSMADLLIPMAVTSATSISPLNGASRDAQWAPLFNTCTTRSDTFVVYGYMEALRVNVNGPTNNNQADWYTGTYSDDPTNTTAQFIRVAKRRFIAILDRSWCNVPRTTTYANGNNTATDSSGNVYVWNGVSGGSLAGPPGTNWVQVSGTATGGTYRLPRIVALRDLPQ